MGKLLWYRRDPNKALVGMKGLTLEERGAYNTVLDLIYAHDGAVDDDERFLAGWLGVDVRVWRRLRARLIDLGKLYLSGGSLRNEAADAEVDRGLGRVASAQNAGHASAEKRARGNNKNKDLASTAAATGDPTNQNQDQTPPSLRSGGGARATSSRGSRLPADWMPSAEDQNFAVDKLGSLEATREEFAKFRDHWNAQPGAKGVKLDWPGVWRNWCRNARRFNGPGRGTGARQRTFEEIADELRGNDETAQHSDAADNAAASGGHFDFGGAVSARR